MNILDPFSLHKLSSLFDQIDCNPVYEHQAVHVRDLDLAITAYQRLDYTLVKRIDKVAFIQNPSRKRLELIPLNVPEHDAWAVKSLDEWTNTYTRILQIPEFEKLD